MDHKFFFNSDCGLYLQKDCSSKLQKGSFPAEADKFFLEKAISFEKKIFGPSLLILKKLSILGILEKIASLSIILAVFSYISNEEMSHSRDVYAAWEVVNSVDGTHGNTSRKAALEFLNLPPLKFPWFFHRYPQEDLSQINLSGADLSGISLPMAQMPEVNMSQGTFTQSNFAGANLYNSDMSGASLIQANFDEAFLDEADLREANLFDASMREVSIRNANLDYARIWAANLTGSELRNSILTHAMMRNSTLDKVDLRGADLRFADLEGTSFQGAFYDNKTKFPANLNPKTEGMVYIGPESKIDSSALKGKRLSEANLSHSSMSKVDLCNFTSQDSNFEYSNFSGSSLREINFARSRLRGSLMTAADLSGAFLYASDMREVNFLGSNLSGADMSHVDLRGADLRSSILDGTRLYHACFDRGTKFPNNFDPKKKKMVEECGCFVEVCLKKTIFSEYYQPCPSVESIMSYFNVTEDKVLLGIFNHHKTVCDNLK